jgi:streptomycin 6-kinase
MGLRTWAGHGAVEVLDHDPDRHALLIERCRPGHALIDEGGTLAAVTIGAEIGARLHAAEAPSGMPTLGQVLATWAQQLERQLAGVPPAHPVLAQRALETMRTRPIATADSVLLHGDLNPTNVLAAEREPWLAIDPKPMVGDAAYDGPRLVTQPDPLVMADPRRALAERVATVSEVMGVDRSALLEWCLVGAVEVGASAWWRGERTAGERCDAHVELLAPMLP